MSTGAAPSVTVTPAIGTVRIMPAGAGGALWTAAEAPPPPSPARTNDIRDFP
jgi:hypothetical protein